MPLQHEVVCIGCVLELLSVCLPTVSALVASFQQRWACNSLERGRDGRRDMYKYRSDTNKLKHVPICRRFSIVCFRERRPDFCAASSPLSSLPPTSLNHSSPDTPSLQHAPPSPNPPLSIPFLLSLSKLWHPSLTEGSDNGQ